MTTSILLASTFTGIAMFVMGFWLARMIYRPAFFSAEFRGLINRGSTYVLDDSRTDAERAAGMVS
jgi:hypothetical protein